METSQKGRKLIVVSGYYGYGNLGDEAICEQLVAELLRLVPAKDILVLSANPEATTRAFGVPAAARADLAGLLSRLGQARLLVSGGGGLFQDTRSPGSVVFYGAHIAIAKALGAQSIVYAQGVGPLKTAAGKVLTRLAFKQCNAISVRDRQSHELMQAWGLKSELTADPVWCLAPTPPAPAVQAALEPLAAGRDAEHPLIGLSLRPSTLFSDQHNNCLLAALSAGLPAGARLLLLPLQRSQDEPVLSRFLDGWQKLGRQAVLLDTSELVRPSQWLAVLAQLDLLVSMRLHALIMALASAVPSVGIAYDPKVSKLLTEFEQPILNLAQDNPKEDWLSAIKQAFSKRVELSCLAVGKSESAKKLACQNFNLLSRILSMQSDP
jgi:polysaccharide pyruvyl transferase CsaB